jgi:type I restriction enzyme S subunit
MEYNPLHNSKLFSNLEKTNYTKKNSGIDWIGEIPNHWEVIKLGFVSKPISGTLVEFDELLHTKENDCKRFITIMDYTTNEIPRYINLNRKTCDVTKEDIVMVRYGTTSGTVYRGIEGVLGNNLFKISVSDKLNIDFLFHYLKQPGFYKTLISERTGIYPEIGFSVYKNQKIVLPPIEEQIKISEILTSYNQNINEMIFNNEKKISLLKEINNTISLDLLSGTINLFIK